MKTLVFAVAVCAWAQLPGPVVSENKDMKQTVADVQARVAECQKLELLEDQQACMKEATGRLQDLKEPVKQKAAQGLLKVKEEKQVLDEHRKDVKARRDACKNLTGDAQGQCVKQVEEDNKTWMKDYLAEKKAKAKEKVEKLKEKVKEKKQTGGK